MCVAAAIIGGAVIGGGATLAAGSSAANATSDAANTAANVQLQGLAQQKQLAAPYTALGQSALPQLQALLGIGGNSQSALAALQNTPGYQFAKQQGTQGIQNASTLNAGPISSGTLQQLDQFNSGLAQNTYQQAVGNIFNTVGLGQAAAAGQAANIGNAASNLSNIAVNQGNNIANIDVNEAASLSKLAGNAGGNYLQYQTIQNLLGGSGGGATGPTTGFGG